MDPKPGRFFIWDRREVVVLLLLTGVVALFSFTLGLHLGKRVHQEGAGSHTVASTDSPLVETQEDIPPAGVELQGLEKATDSENEALLDHSLKDEVSKSGIKLEKQKQVTLPTEKMKHAPTQLHSSTNSNQGEITLQVGSFPKEEEAQARWEELTSHGLKPELRETEVPGVGIRYRVYLGRFGKKDEALLLAKEYREKGWIDSYLVTRAPKGKH